VHSPRSARLNSRVTRRFLTSRTADGEYAKFRGDRMSERWDVSCWDARTGDRSRQFQGCFESKIVADRFVVNDYREHPDRRYQVEQCKHPEHGHRKAASPSS